MMGDAVMSEGPNHRQESERYLLNIIKTQLEITEEDMNDPGIVKAKVREANIDKVLE